MLALNFDAVKAGGRSVGSDRIVMVIFVFPSASKISRIAPGSLLSISDCDRPDTKSPGRSPLKAISKSDF